MIFSLVSIKNNMVNANSKKKITMVAYPNDKQTMISIDAFRSAPWRFI
jgi:hypothetical protein